MKCIEFKSWSDFRKWVDDDQRQIMPTYWRGQSDPSLPLASSFERTILKMNGGAKPGASSIYPYDGRYERDGKAFWQPGFYQGMRDRYLDAFKTAASGLRGPAPAELDRDQWWALGRHFGLVTPLLDWTELPYIAAFFGIADLWREPPRDTVGARGYFGKQTIAVYRLFHNESLEGEELRVVQPKVEELGRMHGQRGLFTWLNSERFFELQGFLDHTGRGDLLTKASISDAAVMDGMRDLRAHGIGYRLLFPDLSGAALHANSKWDYF